MIATFPAGLSPLVGVVHLPALPGAPRWAHAGRPSLERTLAFARAQAEAFLAAGFDGLIVENYGDVPFFKSSVPPETVAALALAVREVVRASGDRPVGVNVLRNDGRAALGVAVAAGARFVRVNVLSGVAAADQGLIEGCAAELQRARDALGASPGAPSPVAIWADVHVKHARPLDSDDVARAASDAVERGLADAVIVSGAATGSAPDLAHVARARQGAGSAPLYLGSGLTPEGCRTLAPLLDGAIVASSALRDGKAGNPVDPARAAALVRAFRTARVDASLPRG